MTVKPHKIIWSHSLKYFGVYNPHPYSVVTVAHSTDTSEKPACPTCQASSPNVNKGVTGGEQNLSGCSGNYQLSGATSGVSNDQEDRFDG